VKKLGVTILLWVGGLFGFALAFGLGLATVAYIHVNWQALEAPAAFLFLILGVTLGVAALRMRDSLAEKAVGVASLACFGLSAGFAIFHGWGVEVRAIYNAAAILFVLASLVFSGWLIFRLSRVMRHSAGARPIPTHLGEPSEHAILADAAEPYILYPAKWKIARILLILLAVTAACGIGSVWMLTLNDGRMALAGFCLVFLAALCALTCFLLISRLVAHKPALIVTHLGLIDGASALYTGVGPIWWEEIRNVTIYTTPKAFLRPRYRYLDITPMNAHALLRRQPFMRRLLLRFFSPIPFVWLGCHIPAWMFSQPLEATLEQIERIAWGDEARQWYHAALGETNGNPVAEDGAKE
jgi:hypothetical protein